MPDLQGFTITAQSAANVNVPRATISCTVLDATTGAVLADLTGANAIQWPGVIATLTAADRRELAQLIATWLVRKVAGV